jgi:hypothetical protein
MVGDISPLFLLAPLLVVVWLLIPTVRAAYWRASIENLHH